MIRHASVRFRRMGAVSVDPVSAGLSVAIAGANLWMNNIRINNDAKTATTLIVNGLADQLHNLLSSYMSLSNPTCADQRAALDAYDQAWLWLQSPQGCGYPGYGSAGNRCVSERAPGGKYSLSAAFRDPIANDPRLAGKSCDSSQEVILPSVTTGTYQPLGVTAAGQPIAVSTDATSSTSGTTPLLSATASAGIPTPILIAGAVLASLFLFSGSRSSR